MSGKIKIKSSPATLKLAVAEVTQDCSLDGTAVNAGDRVVICGDEQTVVSESEWSEPPWCWIEISAASAKPELEVE